ncbi:glycosyltransferase family protein [Subtercola endophyticus]|uniref:hypothetical protein n=1 Tax=Subtercola endophyticus TaxID=2895559 RepID=UPI001E3CF3E5|nr:hypothetical protein [Subtercola endophyticus]UFS57871.1 hypothetical protein LQ955_12585 [Subtercola endophyticus]
MREAVEHRILIINTLGGALLHYTKALSDNLEGAGYEVAVATIFEPSQATGGRLTWILRYLRVLLSARRMATNDKKNTVIVTWPVLGYLDLLLGMILGRRAVIEFVVHDPEPLVSAVGYDRRSRRLSRWAPFKRGLVVHSDAALADVVQQGFEAIVTKLPHPILPVAQSKNEPVNEPKVVRVLGQFKPDRDVKALEEISASIGPGVLLEIRGRRWPQIAGWHVSEGFVPEDELQSLLRTSDAVVVPYKRFYQSGIAIRCLEYGVPIVGPAGTSLEDLVGKSSPLLVSDTGTGAGWTSAIANALASDKDDVLRMVDELRLGSRKAWHEFIDRAGRT